MTTVINLIGGPGCGKSTLAAIIYARMKKRRMKVEMVREVAKDYAWEGRKIGPFEQLSILGEQIKKESSLYNKVKYVITDSPVLLGSFYFEYNHNEGFGTDMVLKFYEFSEKNGVRYLNFLLPRNKEYDEEGRFESEKAAKEIDRYIEGYLDCNNINFERPSQNMTDDEIAALIIGELK